MRRFQQIRNSSRGFTFIEIMLVVVIIGILMAVVIPRMAGRTKGARVTVAKQSLNSVKTALGNFELKAGRYPTTEEGLQGLVEKPSGLKDDEWDKAFEDVPKDPWGEDFVYKSPGENNKDYDLFSKGPDKTEGNADDVSLGAKKAS